MLPRETLVCAIFLTLSAAGCGRKDPPAPTKTEPVTSVAISNPLPSVPVPSASAAPPQPGEPEEAPTEEEVEIFPKPVEWAGPYLVVTRTSAGVYSEPKDRKKLKIGYMRSGGRVPVREGNVGTDGCSQGWREIVGGGFICGNVGTTNLNSPEVKFSIKQPDLEEILPYKYARNVKNGTPLYLSVPSREQMVEYEPYLDTKNAKEKEAEPEGKEPPKSASKAKRDSDEAATIPEERAPEDKPSKLDAGVPGAGGAAGEKPKAWWQSEDTKLHEVTLESLDESDGVIAKRMVKGFYVAIDRTFNWSGRNWYKTTKGLVAPSDRLSQTNGSDFHGVQLDADWTLPVGWVYGWSKDRPVYEFDPEKKQLKPKGSQKHFTAVKLSGKEMTLGKKDYVELADGTWMRAAHVRITKPNPPPADLEPHERWIDINLTTQTLVAYIGIRPYYATLISSGKSSNIKDKDHSTPVGEYRVRGKHVTTTMDGDGTAAGDLPYSIEDVPYVMYFYKAYALHGAFWHRNYGVKMSHGCVNLAPLDAKFLFFFAEPAIPYGWHGVWASEQRPGSRVMVHE